MSVGVRVLMACVLAASVGIAAKPAAAAPDGTDQNVPAVELSSDEVEPDQEIDVTISGFSSRVVTVTVCGNMALRGSGDCNMSGSESTRVNEDGSPHDVLLVVNSPPVPCPCLVRASSPTNDEAAVAPITLTGHPVAEPVQGAEPDLPLVVAIRADRAAVRLLDTIRGSLGGPTGYDVTITIRNTATEAIDGISVAAAAGRKQDHLLAVVDVVPPASIAAGATWEDTVRVELPAPVWGDVRWSADVTGRGNTVEAFDDTSSLPTLLISAVGVLLFVAVALSVRLVLRIRNRRRGERANQAVAEGAVINEGASPDSAWTPEREFERV